MVNQITQSTKTSKLNCESSNKPFTQMKTDPDLIHKNQNEKDPQ